jgi:hypothetical protein
MKQLLLYSLLPCTDSSPLEVVQLPLSPNHVDGSNHELSMNLYQMQLTID